jgi:hypothetical protein
MAVIINMATISRLAVVRSHISGEVSVGSSLPLEPAAVLRQFLADTLRRGDWRVEREPGQVGGPYRPDLVIRKGRAVFAVELKAASEARADRLIPLFAQAILQAGAIGRHAGRHVRPLVVVAAPRVSPSAADRLRQFGAEFAPGLAFGIIDGEGFRYFNDPALSDLSVLPSGQRRRPVVGHRLPDLFSELNQWMLKVLLAPRIPEKYLRAPRSRYRNASELAKAAQVSVMSAFRLVSRLQEEGFLDAGERELRIVRIDDLMMRWAASERAARDIPARWILGGSADRLRKALRSQFQDVPDGRGGRRPLRRPLRACLGLFAAADGLGVGFVHGAIPHVYVDRVDAEGLRKLGLLLSEREGKPDVFLRVPPRPEPVFRGAVFAGNVPTSDVVQVWLDVQGHPARGRQQAEEIRRRVLAPLFSERDK